MKIEKQQQQLDDNESHRIKDSVRYKGTFISLRF